MTSNGGLDWHEVKVVEFRLEDCAYSGSSCVTQLVYLSIKVFRDRSIAGSYSCQFAITARDFLPQKYGGKLLKIDDGK
jgi:hypothetical protein